MRITSVFITALLIASSALADWEGTVRVEVRTGGNSPIEMTGKVRAKKHLQRTDLTLLGVESSSIVDMKKEKVWNLIHAQKIAMEIAATELASESTDSKIPTCTTEDVEGCLTK